MTRTEAWFALIAFLVVVLGYVWRRLGEPSPRQYKSKKPDVGY
ncbi:MAG: hypothetical protein U0599_02335 [Vicinamibacteria bacterium]